MPRIKRWDENSQAWVYADGVVTFDPEVDNTLTKSDAAANARAVGDALTYAGRNLVNTADPFLRGANVEASGKTVILSYKENKDTYFRITTTENLVQGEQYVLSFDCAGVPADTQGKNFNYMVGSAVFTPFNGRVVVAFKAGSGDVSGSVIIDDNITVSSMRPTADIVGAGIVLSNFSIEKGSFSAGYRHNEQEYDRLRIPVLTTTQKKEIKALADAYFNADATFYYDYGVVRNDYATNRCYDPKGTYNRFGMCCNTFCEMVWMGRDISDFVGKNKDTYSNKITKAFDWGYYFDFKDRANLAGVAERDKEGNFVRYYNFKNPNGYDSDNFKGSYSTNSYYDPDLTDNPANLVKYPKLNWFRSFMTATDVAQELYRMGCEIPFEELDIGDLVFTKPRYTLNTEDETFSNRISWKNISHVVMVYDKAADGTLTFMDCTDRSSDTRYIFKSTTNDKTYLSNVAEAIEIMGNTVMCARHPAAWGKDNMADIEYIDYMPMRETTGYSTGQAIPFTAGMAVTAGLWYVYNNELGKALTTGTASEWTSTYFDIQYKNNG